MFLWGTGYTQTDTLYTKTKRKIPCKIVEVNDQDIKYKLVAIADGPLYVMSKDKIFRYSLSSGFSEIIVPDELSLENEHGEISNKRTVIKIQPFGLMNAHVSFAFERVIKVGTNLDIEMGYVNSSMNKRQMIQNNVYTSYGKEPLCTGLYLKPGVKFFLGQDFSMKGMKYAHPLKGRYLKFDLAISYLSFQNVARDVQIRSQMPPYYYSRATLFTNITSVAYGGFINYGRQFILANALTLEYYIGVGYSGNTTTYSNPDFNKNYNPNGYYMEGGNYMSISNYYGFYRLTDFGLSATAGFRIGYIFSTNDRKKTPVSESN
jgi:hypothetical protein